MRPNQDASPRAAAISSAAVSERMSPEPNTCLHGRYELKSVLGEGATAKVWRAIDKKLAKPVAIKEFGSWEGSEQQHHREVRCLQLLNKSDAAGEYVLRMFDTFNNDMGRPCIVMEVRLHRLREKEGQIAQTARDAQIAT
jgi:serine/threonine protein kinase